MGDAPRIVAGVDGGGTHTRVLLMDEDGVTLGSGEGGSGNLHDVGEVQLRAHIDSAWRAAWRDAGLSPRAASRVFCAMASVGTGGNRETVQRVVAEVGVGRHSDVVVDIDLVGAHAGGLGGGPGIALIAGTGSSCYGRDPAGAWFQSGGWGSVLDDVGSATWLGTQAMVAAIRAFDRRGPATALEGLVMERFALTQMRELLPKVDAEGLGRIGRAQLARLVTAAAEDGDAVATELLNAGADALAECAQAVWRTLEFGTEAAVEVVVTGGLAENVPDYRHRIHAAVCRRVPPAICVLPRRSNVEGAALLALAQL